MGDLALDIGARGSVVFCWRTLLPVEGWRGEVTAGCVEPGSLPSISGEKRATPSGMRTATCSVHVPRISTRHDARDPLGVETQQPWSDLAMARTTPALLARRPGPLFVSICGR